MLSKNSVRFRARAQGLNTDQLEVSVCTEIMKNHHVGSPVSPSQQICAIHDDNLTPLLFTIGTDQGGYVIYADSGSRTGWNSFDLRVSLHSAFNDIDETVTVMALEVSQDSDGTFRIVMAVDGATEGPLFYYTEDLKLTAQQSPAAFWSGIGKSWHKRDGLGTVINSANLEKATVSKFLLSNKDDDNGSATAIVEISSGGTTEMYFMNIDASDTSWTWFRFSTPADVTEIKDFAIGTVGNIYGGYRGVFLIGRTATEEALFFKALPANIVKNGADLEISFSNTPASMSCLTVLPGDFGKSAYASAYGSDLYVGADGLYLYKAEAIATDQKDAVNRNLVPNAVSGNITEILGSSSGNSVSLWFTSSDSSDDMISLQGTNDDSNPWSAPVSLIADVLQLAAVRDESGAVEDVVYLTGDNQVHYVYRDMSTTLWHTVDIALLGTGNTVSYNSYETTLSFRSDPSTPLAQKQVSVSVSESCYLDLNGITYRMKADSPIISTTDRSGAVNLSLPVTSTSSPVFHITADFLDSGFDLHPAAQFNQTLHDNYQTADALSGATYQFSDPQAPGSNGAGAKVLQGDYASAGRVQGGAAALKSLTGLAVVTTPNRDKSVTKGQNSVFFNNTGKPARTINTNRLPSRYAWGLQVNGGDVRYADGSDAQSIIATFEDPVSWFFGDLIHHLENFVDEAESCFVHLTEDGLHLLIKIGEEVISVVVDVLEHLWKALNWFLGSVFGINLDDIIRWIGFLFEFKYYGYTKDAIETAINQLLSLAIDEVDTLQSEVDSKLQSLIEKFESKIPNPSPSHGTNTANREFSSMAEDILSPGTLLFENPVTRWIGSKIDDVLDDLFGSDKTVPGWAAKLTADTESLLEKCTSEETDNLITLVEQIGTSLSHSAAGKLDMKQLIEQIGDELIGAALKALKELVDAVFELLEDVLTILKNEFLPAEHEIPVISELYKLFTGNDLTVSYQGTLSLVLSIPTTIITYVASGDYPFNQSNPAVPLPSSLSLHPSKAVSAQGPAPTGFIRVGNDSNGFGHNGNGDTLSAGMQWFFAVPYSLGRFADLGLTVLSPKFKNCNLAIWQMMSKLPQLLGYVPLWHVVDQPKSSEWKKVNMYLTCVSILPEIMEGACEAQLKGENTSYRAKADAKKGKKAAQFINTLLTIAKAGVEIAALRQEVLNDEFISTTDENLLLSQAALGISADVLEVFISYDEDSPPQAYVVLGVAGMIELILNLVRLGVDTEGHTNN